MKSSISPEPTLLVDIKEAARLLGVSQKSIWTASNEGRLPSVRVGRRRLWARASLQQFVAAQVEAQSVNA